jgi:hypothetical protein
LTPETPENKAIAVIFRDLSIRCPLCFAIIEVTEPLARVMWKTRVRQTEESLSLLVREALKVELERRAAKVEREQHGGSQPDAPAGGCLPDVH